MDADYQMIDTPKGKRYLKNGRLISKNALPKEEMERLGVDKVKNELADKTCLFCDGDTHMSRFINLTMVPLCKEHYYTKTTGKIVEKLRSA